MRGFFVRATLVVDPARRLNSLSLTALISLALLTIGGQVVVHQTLSAQDGQSRLINISGRQRMLSQRLAKAALALTSFQDPVPRSKRLEELQLSLDRWEKVHLGLQYGDQDLQLSGDISLTTQALFEQVDPYYQVIQQSARQIVSLLSNDSNADISEPLRQILRNEGAFLESMDQIVLQYERETEERILYSQRIGWALSLTTLLILAIQSRYIFAPAVDQIRRLITQLQEQAKDLQEKKTLLETELTRAARVQAELLPQDPPSIPSIELAACCIPAKEVGGDFYDWHCPEADRLNLTLADVMGKGMPAALLMATTRAALRAGPIKNSPLDMVRSTLSALELDLERSESYVTLFQAQLNLSLGLLTYVDAGHGHGFVWRANGLVEPLKSGGVPLGGVQIVPYRESTLLLDGGDTLIVYSDGVVDAHPELRLDPAQLATQLKGSSTAMEMVSRLVELTRTPTAPADDITVLVLRRIALPPSDPHSPETRDSESPEPESLG